MKKQAAPTARVFQRLIEH